MSLETKHFYDFGDFRLDPAEKVLLRDGEFVSVTPKVFETLCVLIEGAGRTIEKDELMRRIWQNRSVEEGNLTFNIGMLRKALGDDASDPTFIETVPRRGYRFIAEVKEISRIENEAENSPEETDFQPTEKKFAASEFKKFLLPVVSAVILFIGTIAVGSWYLQGKSFAAAPVLAAPFSSEKLSTNGKVEIAVVSPDGKNVAYRNTAGGKQSVWLRQLESGNNVEIIAPSDNVYQGLAFSPDADFLYFSRRPKNFGGQVEIYRVSIFGGVATKIVNEAQGWFSVSPDGGKISFVRCYFRADENCSLWIADALDGKNEKKLAARPPPIRISDNKISPDGTKIAFAVGQSENQANEFGLVEIDINSGAERELTAQKFFNIKSLAWLPDKSGLLFTARQNTESYFRIWQVSAASGAVHPLAKNSETYLTLSLDKEANVLAATQVKEDLRLLLFQSENPLRSRVLANAATVAFAPSGKIIFSSSMSGNIDIWSINADGSEQRQLTNDAAEESAPVASPDGSSIFFASNRTGAVNVWRMNADGSNQTQITNKEGGFPLFVTPDGRWLYYSSGRQRTLWRVSTGGGGEQMILDKEKYRFAFSPDGLQLAFSENRNDEKTLKIVSLSDLQTIKTFKFADPKKIMTEIAWLPDGKTLAYILANNEYENNTLWRQPLDKSPQQIADLGDELINSFVVSPDGTQFALVRGTWNHDAVLIKGLK